MASDDLLGRVHDRIGGQGVTITTGGVVDHVEIRWCRDYGPPWHVSDERFVSGVTLTEALLAVLEYEDEADALDHRETDGI